MIAQDLVAARVQRLQRQILQVEERAQRAPDTAAYMHDMARIQQLTDELKEAQAWYFSLSTDCALLKKQAD